MDSQLHEKIRQARKALGFTQMELAHLMEMKQGEVSRVESGRRVHIPTRLLHFLIDRGISAQWLLTGTGVMMAPPEPEQLVGVRYLSQERLPKFLLASDKKALIENCPFVHLPIPVGRNAENYLCVEAPEEYAACQVLLIGQRSLAMDIEAGRIYLFFTKEKMEIWQVNNATVARVIGHDPGKPDRGGALQLRYVSEAYSLDYEITINRTLPRSKAQSLPSY